MVYEKCKTALLEYNKGDNQNRSEGSNVSQIPPVQLFFAAGLSKFIAICATYPHEGSLVIAVYMTTEDLNIYMFF
jgi:hypothetical protein